MKNKKGFTLIELLATIAILGILATIAGVSVSKVMKDSKEKTSEIQESMINEAIKAYVLDTYGTNIKNNTYTIDAEDLESYIEGDVDIPSSFIVSFDENGKLSAGYSSNYNSATSLGIAKNYMKDKIFAKNLEEGNGTFGTSESRLYTCCIEMDNDTKIWWLNYTTKYVMGKSAAANLYSISYSTNNNCYWPCDDYLE